MYGEAERALGAWSWPSSAQLRTNRDGLINQTFVVIVQDAPAAVLQRLNTRVFVPEVHEDIEAVTRHLRARGMATPLLLRTISGALWHTAPDGGVWRCLTYEGDRTIHRIEQPQEARQAGALVAWFHRGTSDLAWQFRSVRAGAHDTDKHMTALAESLQAHGSHRLREQVGPLAEEILGRWRARGSGARLERRIVHGDLKISNVRFKGEAAHCLIDLDTMALEALDVELGDAMRSWCNPGSEDAQQTCFDLRIFEAAITGYAAGWQGAQGPSDDEWDAIVPGIERIALELASRFARDALEENYFGWDPRFGSRGQHNLLRARGQLALARSVDQQRGEAERVVLMARRTSATGR